MMQNDFSSRTRNRENSPFRYVCQRRSAALVLVIVAFCLPAPVLAQSKSGCEQTPDATLGQMIGGIAGGLAGNQVGKGNGNVAATIGGALLGGLAGGEIQKQMQKPDCKTSEKQKPKQKSTIKSQDAAKPPAPAPSQANSAPAAASAIATSTSAAAPDTMPSTQDQSAATLQSQYAAAKTMYENNANYRKRIDRSVAESLADYDAAVEREAVIEAQFRDSGITTRHDQRITELRQWISSNRSDIASNHVELTDKLRELGSLKRQQASEWNRLATSLSQPANGTLKNAETTSSNSTLSPQATNVQQISAKFDPDDTKELEQRKRKFLFHVVKALSDSFDEKEKSYHDSLIKLQSDYPEFQDEVAKVISDPAYRQSLAEILFADSKLRFLTEADYRNSQIKSIQLALSEFDINAEGDSKAEQLFKSANFTSRYDEPIRAIKNKINQQRNDLSNYLILGLDILKYTNMRDWRIAEWNTRGPEQGDSSAGAPASIAAPDMTKAVDDLLIEDSQSWIFNHYVKHSVKNVKITKTDNNGAPTIIHADYSYNQGQHGWVDLHYKGTKLSCLKFFDFPDRCRALGNSPSAEIAAGMIIDMALDTGSSGGDERHRYGDARSDIEETFLIQQRQDFDRCRAAGGSLGSC